MSDAVVAAYTIGQTPRPDLTKDLGRRFASVSFEIVGALDGLADGEIPPCGADEDPLETRLTGGSRAVVGAPFVESRLQAAIGDRDDRVVAHLVLCAGSFPTLSSRRALILPFKVGASELARRGLLRLDVVVPFAGQAPSAVRKWESAGFVCRPHALEQSRDPTSVSKALSDRLSGSDADAVVFDYVGLPVSIVDEVASRLDKPVFDLGHLATDALERTLQTL